MWIYDRLVWLIFWLLGILGLGDRDHAHDPPHKYTFAQARDRASAIVAQMTMEEKLSVTSGHAGPCQANSGSVERLGVPSFCYNDGRECRGQVGCAVAGGAEVRVEGA